MKKRKTHKLKNYIIIALIVAVGLIFVLFFLPKNNSGSSFAIDDKCGPFMGSILHTLADESTCESRCRAQCITFEEKFDYVEFTDNEPACHNCMCFCK